MPVKNSRKHISIQYENVRFWLSLIFSSSFFISFAHIHNTKKTQRREKRVTNVVKRYYLTPQGIESLYKWSWKIISVMMFACWTLLFICKILRTVDFKSSLKWWILCAFFSFFSEVLDALNIKVAVERSVLIQIG